MHLRNSRQKVLAVTGRLWTRPGRRCVDHNKRSLADKESQRWLSTAAAAKSVLAAAASVTVVADRESDIYAEWARLPGPGFHLLTRAMHDRVIAEGGRLSTAPLEPAGEAEIDLAAHTGRPARRAKLAARFGRVTLKRPGGTRRFQRWSGLRGLVPHKLRDLWIFTAEGRWAQELPENIDRTQTQRYGQARRGSRN